MEKLKINPSDGVKRRDSQTVQCERPFPSGDFVFLYFAFCFVGRVLVWRSVATPLVSRQAHAPFHLSIITVNFRVIKVILKIIQLFFLNMMFILEKDD